MALLLQCLRDLRTQTGDVDMLPPAAAPARMSGDVAAWTPRQRAATGAAEHRLALDPSSVALRSHAEPAEACH